ncbi:MAG: hypothetical protein DCC75_07980 [Proteobacteria bacterium]|nr:MAG: hypothetical protein DCC75_07980 [Pseudomonadota bacterium]
MAAVIIIVVALLEAALFVGLMYSNVAKRRSDVKNAVVDLENQLKEKQALIVKVEGFYTEMVPIDDLRQKASELKGASESLKTERGRTTITQAELETVEGRLRELEEIERELEASGLETKEEINILKKKEKELAGKNDTLKEQLKVSIEQAEMILSQIKLSAEKSEQVQNMKAELLQTQEKIDSMMQQIALGNEQYFTLKRRYDALDIEYAQLFEKFSEAEAAAKK